MYVYMSYFLIIYKRIKKRAMNEVIKKGNLFLSYITALFGPQIPPR